MDFLYSLKYYCQRWNRALTFAQMLGVIKDETKNFLSGMGKQSNLKSGHGSSKLDPDSKLSGTQES